MVPSKVRNTSLACGLFWCCLSLHAPVDPLPGLYQIPKGPDYPHTRLCRAYKKNKLGVVTMVWACALYLGTWNLRVVIHKLSPELLRFRACARSPERIRGTTAGILHSLVGTSFLVLDSRSFGEKVARRRKPPRKYSLDL